MLVERRAPVAPFSIGALALVLGFGLMAVTGRLSPDPSPAAPAPVGATADTDVWASCGSGIDPVLQERPVRHLAGWSHRCRGRLAEEWSGPVRLTSGERAAPMSVVEVTAGTARGVASDLGGFVVVSADAWAHGGASTRCPCPVALSLQDETAGVALARDQAQIGPQSHTAALSAQQVFPIEAGETKSFTALGSVLDREGPDVDYVVRLTALFVPVPSESDDTLDPP